MREEEKMSMVGLDRWFATNSCSWRTSLGRMVLNNVFLEPELRGEAATRYLELLRGAAALRLLRRGVEPLACEASES